MSSVFPWWLSGKESTFLCRRPRFDPCQEEPLEKGTATPPVFLPGKSHEQRSLEGYSPWGLKELDTTWRLKNKKAVTVRPGQCYIVLNPKFRGQSMTAQERLPIKQETPLRNTCPERLHCSSVPTKPNTWKTSAGSQHRLRSHTSLPWTLSWGGSWQPPPRQGGSPVSRRLDPAAHPERCWEKGSSAKGTDALVESLVARWWNVTENPRYHVLSLGSHPKQNAGEIESNRRVLIPKWGFGNESLTGHASTRAQKNHF